MSAEWKKGPMPDNVFGFGGAVPYDGPKGSGFYFADFKGKTVRLIGPDFDKEIPHHAIAYYTNPIQSLPPRN